MGQGVETGKRLTHVHDHLGRDQPLGLAFIARITSALGTTQDYKYVRELRNAIVHRGLDPVATGHANDATVSVLCPAVVQDLSGNSYSRSDSRPTVTFVTNPVIAEVLEDLDLVNTDHHIVEEDSFHAANDSGATDVAKAVVREALWHMDYAEIAREAATARIKEMRGLLGTVEGFKLIPANKPLRRQGDAFLARLALSHVSGTAESVSAGTGSAAASES